jgi:hypothetical protein
MAVIAFAVAAGDDMARQAGGSRAVPAAGPQSWAGRQAAGRQAGGVMKLP